MFNIFTVVFYLICVNKNNCQLLDKFVAPVVDNQNAPLVAMINTSGITIPIVESLENPIIQLVNTSIECKMNTAMENVTSYIEALHRKANEKINFLNNSYLSFQRASVKNSEDIMSSVNDKLSNLLNSNKGAINVMEKILYDNITNFQQNMKATWSLKDSEYYQNISATHKGLENLSKHIDKQLNNIKSHVKKTEKDMSNFKEQMREELTDIIEQTNAKIDSHIGQKKFEWDRELTSVKNRLLNLEDKGSKFYIAFLSNHARNKDQRSLIYITSENKGQCVIEVPFLNMNRTVNIDIGSTKFEFNIRIKLAINGIEKKAIKINCDVTVQLYGINREYATTDGMIAIPLTSLSIYYIAPSYTVPSKHPHFASEIGIVSTQDNTYLNITLGRQCTDYSYKGVRYTARDVISLKLDEFQTFQMISLYDLSGTLIRSSKPVAVISGNKVLKGGSHGSEMIIPVKNFDQQFIVPKLFGSRFAQCRLYSSVPATINITNANGINEAAVITDTLFLERKCDKTESLSSTSPFMVVLYARRQHGPFMTLVPGIHQYDYSYNIAVFNSRKYPFTSYLTVMTPVIKNIRSDIFIEGLTYQMENIHNVSLNHLSYTTFTISITEGHHKVYSKSKTPFGLIISGDGVYDGYGYPAGLKLN